MMGLQCWLYLNGNLISYLHNQSALKVSECVRGPFSRPSPLHAEMFLSTCEELVRSSILELPCHERGT